MTSQAPINQITKREAKQVWNQNNDNGDGFAVGEEDSNINEIEGHGTLMYAAESDSDVATYWDGEFYTIVGDANGPWAVLFN